MFTSLNTDLHAASRWDIDIYFVEQGGTVEAEPGEKLTVRWEAVLGASAYDVIFTNASTGHVKKDYVFDNKAYFNVDDLGGDSQYNLAVYAYDQNNEYLAQDGVDFFLEVVMEESYPEAGDRIELPEGDELRITYSGGDGSEDEYYFILKDNDSKTPIYETTTRRKYIEIPSSKFEKDRNEYVMWITALDNGNTIARKRVVFELEIVEEIEPTSVELDRSNFTLKVGEKKDIDADVYPSSTADKSVIWSSSNSNIASVSTTGYVTAINEGTATIKATTWNNKSAALVVTVESAEVPKATLTGFDETQETYRKGDKLKLEGTVHSNGGTFEKITVKVQGPQPGLGGEFNSVDFPSGSSFDLSNFGSVVFGEGYIQSGGNYAITVFARNVGHEEGADAEIGSKTVIYDATELQLGKATITVPTQGEKVEVGKDLKVKWNAPSEGNPDSYNLFLIEEGKTEAAHDEIGIIGTEATIPGEKIKDKNYTILITAVAQGWKASEAYVLIEGKSVEVPKATLTGFDETQETYRKGDKLKLEGTVHSNGGTFEKITVKVQGPQPGLGGEFDSVDFPSGSSFDLSIFGSVVFGEGYIQSGGTYAITVFARNVGHEEGADAEIGSKTVVYNDNEQEEVTINTSSLILDKVLAGMKDEIRISGNIDAGGKIIEKINVKVKAPSDVESKYSLYFNVDNIVLDNKLVIGNDYIRTTESGVHKIELSTTVNGIDFDVATLVVNIDNQAPVITLPGPKTVNLGLYESYSSIYWSGATAVDNIDGTCNVVSQFVNSQGEEEHIDNLMTGYLSAGVYHFNYSSKDKAGNISKSTITITVDEQFNNSLDKYIRQLPIMSKPDLSVSVSFTEPVKIEGTVTASKWYNGEEVGSINIRYENALDEVHTFYHDFDYGLEYRIDFSATRITRYYDQNPIIIKYYKEPFEVSFTTPKLTLSEGTKKVIGSNTNDGVVSYQYEAITQNELMKCMALSDFAYVYSEALVREKAVGALMLAYRNDDEVWKYNSEYDSLPYKLHNSEIIRSFIGDQEVIDYRDDNSVTGFRAVATYDDKNETVYINYTGSELFNLGEEAKQDSFEAVLYNDHEYRPLGAEDWWNTNAIMVINSKSPKQFDLALEFYYSIKKRFPDKNIVLTGHSLGGALASSVSIITGETAHVVDSATGHILDVAYLENYADIEFSGYENMNIHNYTDIHPFDLEEGGSINYYINAAVQNLWFDEYHHTVEYESNGYYHPLENHNIYSIIDFNSVNGIISFNEIYKDKNELESHIMHDELSDYIGRGITNHLYIGTEGKNQFTYDYTVDDYFTYGWTVLGGDEVDRITIRTLDYDVFTEHDIQNYFVGGEGDDVLSGYLGEDVYIWRKGDGNDTIYDEFGPNKLKLGKGITEAMISNAGFDEETELCTLKIAVNGQTNEIKVLRSLNDSENYIIVEFYDGSQIKYDLGKEKIASNTGINNSGNVSTGNSGGNTGGIATTQPGSKELLDINEELIPEQAPGPEIKKVSYIEGHQNNFNPSRNITRAEIATIFNRIVDFPSVNGPINLSDISRHWAYKDIIKLNNTDIVKGYTDQTFRPDNNITRSEFVAMVTRLADYTLRAKGAGNVPYLDVDTNDWYYDELQAFEALELEFYGIDDYFDSEKLMTRAEVVYVIDQLVDLDNTPNKVNAFNDVDESHWAYDAIMRASMAQ